MKVHKVIFNSYRTREYQTMTRIVEEDGVLRVEKSPLCLESEDHIFSLKEKAEMVQRQMPHVNVLQPKYCGKVAVFEFANGRSLSDLMADSTLRKDDTEFKQLVSLYWRLVEPSSSVTDQWWTHPSFKSVFGETPPEFCVPRPCLCPANIDVSFDNVHIDQSAPEKPTLFDTEWTYMFPVPLEFCIWRAIRWLEIRVRPGRSSWMTKSGLMDRFDIDSTWFHVYLNWETAFSKTVHGTRPIFALPPSITEKSTARNLNELISNLESTSVKCETLHAESETMRAHIQELSGEAEMLRREIQLVQRTLSWRLTRPLRYVSAMLNRSHDK